jgi:hypothetical protein
MGQMRMMIYIGLQGRSQPWHQRENPRHKAPGGPEKRGTRNREKTKHRPEKNTSPRAADWNQSTVVRPGQPPTEGHG